MLILYVHNKSPLDPRIADYEWVAKINEEPIASGMVRGHVRSEGWVELLRRIVRDQDGVPRSQARGRSKRRR